MQASTALFNIKLRTFIAITNRIGDKGSPCRSPDLLLKYPEETPFIETEKVGVVMQARTQEIKT